MANKEYRPNKISKLNIEQKEYFIYGYCYRLVQELIENEDELKDIPVVSLMNIMLREALDSLEGEKQK